MIIPYVALNRFLYTYDTTLTEDGYRSSWYLFVLIHGVILTLLTEKRAIKMASVAYMLVDAIAVGKRFPTTTVHHMLTLVLAISDLRYSAELLRVGFIGDALDAAAVLLNHNKVDFLSLSRWYGIFLMFLRVWPNASAYGVLLLIGIILNQTICVLPRRHDWTL